MHSFSESSLDDLMRGAIETLISSGDHTSPTKGPARELRGVTLELTNPRARLSRSETRGRVFSCIAELCWYLSRSDRVEPIQFYLSHYRDCAEADGSVHGAYGPRLFAFDGADQVQLVIATLKRRPFSRQAVIQIFDHEDLLEPYKHVPCTCLLQFFVRSERLEAVTYMRSNDAYLGLPHDVFAFTMLQELIARSLDVDLGAYVHMIGSLHVYESDVANAQAFLDEGWQSAIEMPVMPLGDPWPSVDTLVTTEKALRNGNDPLGLDFDGDPYWQDLARLLAIFRLHVARRDSDVAGLRAGVSSAIYDVFLADRFGPE
jgi:thymidylate synthase